MREGGNATSVNMEIGLYDDVKLQCRQPPVYKTAAKEIAAQHGQALTFMAKYNEREGRSCHIHLSLRGLEDEIGVLARRRPHRCTTNSSGNWTMMRLTLLYAPKHQFSTNVSPTVLRPDHRCVGTRQPFCAIRLVGKERGAAGEPRLAVMRTGIPRLLRRWALASTASSMLELEPLTETRTPPTSQRSQHPAEARDAFTTSAAARQVSATKLSITTPPWPTIEFQGAFEASVTDWGACVALRTHVREAPVSNAINRRQPWRPEQAVADVPNGRPRGR